MASAWQNQKTYNSQVFISQSIWNKLQSKGIKQSSQGWYPAMKILGGDNLTKELWNDIHRGRSFVVDQML